MNTITKKDIKVFISGFALCLLINFALNFKEFKSDFKKGWDSAPEFVCNPDDCR
jgi:hypothetical protein